MKKSTRRQLRERPSGSNEEREEDHGKNDDAEAINSIEYTSKIKVVKVGDLTPVQDFEAMMSRRDGAEWVKKAIKDMKEKIFTIVEGSFEEGASQKALGCVVALRKGCILEQVSLLPVLLGLSCIICETIQFHYPAITQWVLFSSCCRNSFLTFVL